jgi:iron complex transport system ATP-binding protein
MRNSGAPFVIEMESLVLGYSQASPLNEPFSARLEGAGIHLIVGRNGAGKSTLIRTLAGLQAPLNGSIKWKGQLLSKASAKERGEGMAFMASTPPRTSGLRVAEVLDLMSPTIALRDQTLRQVGATPWLDRRLSSLSDGQAQRVMLARALLQQTPWIVLDEPTAFLDAPSRTALRQTLLELSQTGVGMILASHDFHGLQGRDELTSIHALNASGWNALDRLHQATDWESQL